jgi:hypothetical protein
MWITGITNFLPSRPSRNQHTRKESDRAERCYLIPLPDPRGAQERQSVQGGGLCQGSWAVRRIRTVRPVVRFLVGAAACGCRRCQRVLLRREEHAPEGTAHVHLSEPVEDVAGAAADGSAPSRQIGSQSLPNPATERRRGPAVRGRRPAPWSPAPRSAAHPPQSGSPRPHRRCPTISVTSGRPPNRDRMRLGWCRPRSGRSPQQRTQVAGQPLQQHHPNQAEPERAGDLIRRVVAGGNPAPSPVQV